MPNEAIEKAIVSSLKLQQQGYKKAQGLTKRIEAYNTDYLRQLRAVVTPAKWSRWTQARLKNRTELRDAIAKAEPSYDGEKQTQKKTKEIIASGEKLQRDLDFDITAATKLRDEHSNRLDKAFKTVWAIPDRPTFLRSKDPRDPDDNHPLRLFTPPYPGGSWEAHLYKTDEPRTPKYVCYLDRISGELGSYTYTRVSGADNSDASFAWVRTGVRLWYQMPVTGRFRLWMHLQAIHDNYWGRLSDECGWSDAKVLLHSRPYVRVTSPTLNHQVFGNYILYYTRHNNDAYWDRNVNGDGWIQINYDDEYPANQWISIEAGITDMNSFWSNDVTVRSRMKMKWSIPQILVYT